MQTHALAPAYPVGHVSSQLLGPRAWARLADAGRAFFLGGRVGHVLNVRLPAALINRKAGGGSPMRLMCITTG